MSSGLKIASIALAVLTAFSSSAYPQSDSPSAAAADATTRPAEDVESVRLSAGRENEYDSLIADLRLEGDQLAAFKKADAERLAALRAFVEGAEGQQLMALREKMAAARREKRTDDVPALRAEIQPLSDRYWAVRNQGRMAVLKTLSEPQLARVAGGALYARVARALAAVTPTQEQKGRTRAICDEAAARWFKMSMLESDPFFREITPLEASTRERVISEVLTDQQRAALTLQTKRAATHPTTGGTANTP